jgi:hypothetical protein
LKYPDEPSRQFSQIFRVGEGEIGHDQLSQQQLPKHCAMDDPAGALFIAARSA